MKLPNFLDVADLNRLKSAMGIPRNKIGNLRGIEVRRLGATREEIRQLREEGLEVDKQDVIALPDGTYYTRIGVSFFIFVTYHNTVEIILTRDFISLTA